MIEWDYSNLIIIKTRGEKIKDQNKDEIVGVWNVKGEEKRKVIAVTEDGEKRKVCSVAENTWIPILYHYVSNCCFCLWLLFLCLFTRASLLAAKFFFFFPKIILSCCKDYKHIKLILDINILYK